VLILALFSDYPHTLLRATEERRSDTLTGG
jgi:hypothetical protein